MGRFGLFLDHFWAIFRQSGPFLTVSKETKCFIAEKNASFCTILHILVNFGGYLHIFAFSRIILLNVAVNFPKPYSKSQYAGSNFCFFRSRFMKYQT